MSGRLRVAVVGCGRVSRTAHYDAIKGNPAYEFAAVCDTDRGRADEWSRRNNVCAYYDMEDMLANERLDLVAICTPNGLHAAMGAAAAGRGVNLLVEKPLAMTVAQADDLIAAAEANGVRLFNVLQNRFNATNKLLKAAVEKGRFGRLLSCNVTLRWRRELPYYTEDGGWRGRRDMAGGVFTNQAVHYVDMLQWLVGAPATTAYARMRTAVHPVEVETYGCGIIEFENGVIGSLDLTNHNYPTDTEGSVTLVGETGTVKIGGKSMNKVLEWSFADPDPDDEAVKGADSEPPTVYGFGHIEMYERVALELAGSSERPAPDGLEGRKAVALLDALYRSAGTGAPEPVSAAPA